MKKNKSKPAAGPLSPIEAFETFWNVVARNEEFLAVYGQNSSCGWEKKCHHDLVKAYESVEPHLKAASRKQLFDTPAGIGEVDRFCALNFHQALVLILNPPERWFRRLWMLNSPEWVAIKAGARAEEDTIICSGSTRKAVAHRSGRRRIPGKTNRAEAEKGELLSVDAKVLLDWLLKHHGCSSGEPNCTAAKNQHWIAEQISAKGTPFTQTRVSHALEELMSKVPSFHQVLGPKGVKGDKTYRRLCKIGEICDTLDHLHLKSNQHIHRQLQQSMERNVEDIERYANRGF